MNKLDKLDMEILKQAYLNTLSKKTGEKYVLDSIKIIPQDILNERLEKLISEKLVTKNYEITDLGRKNIKVGVIGGVFDILHIGHINVLRKAKQYVDLLIAIIATDDTVKKLKHRDPIHRQEWRKKVISSLKFIDAAIIGEEREFKKPLIKVSPDIIFLGYDQKIPPGISEEELEGLQVIKLNFKIEGIKTSIILEKLLH